MTMYTVDIHSCPGYAFRLSERSFRLFIRRPVYRSVRSASDKALLPVRAFAHSRLPRHQRVRLEKGNYPTLSAFFAQMATD